MDVLSEIIKPVVQVLMDPVKKQLSYLISCTKYVRDMHTKMRELDVARQGEEEHLKQNTESRLEISSQVRGWLEEVENFPSGVNSCCNLKARHKLGRQAFKISEQIDCVKSQYSLIKWTDDPIPLGRVDSIIASTSTQSTIGHDKDFQSREHIFMKALKALEPNHNSHMIALCGMGGVGKTTMMKRLKKVVKEKKIFNYIIEAVIGEKTDPIAIQEAVSNYLGIELKEKTKPVRADKLCEGFKVKSDGGKNKFLVILDDVWESVDLEDIGLSPLPNRGVDFKVLLTSRNRDVCTMMGVEVEAILNMNVLPEAEAQSFFRQFIGIADPELHKIGEKIARKCCGLPIAIKTMACTLRSKGKDAWKNALTRLEYHDIDSVVNEVFETSYNNLQDEEAKSVFLLCALFPEDFDIPTEDLMRYGWGLKLFNKVYTIREARSRLSTFTERLIHTNLLTESDNVGSVKMHDPVRSFVMDMFSKGGNTSFVNHDNMLEWPANEMSTSCERISLTCKGMSEFPQDLKFPNLSMLKLMHGDKLLKFHEEFYEKLENLQVLSYDKMMYPFLSSSLQSSTNLRVLCLHRCSLKFDCSSIGNLISLEVLSFANSGIEWLPSTIKNLKNLRLLDMTYCSGLRIDNGILKNLVKLEELYVRVAARPYRRAIYLTDDNCTEMRERLKSLSALEFEFFQNNAQPKDMTYENLERFKISVGRYLDGDFSKSKLSFENTLQLVTNKGELLESRMNALFEKTDVLCLSVDDMNDLEDVEMISCHPPQSSSFYNLRFLVVTRCAELRYLFTHRVAKDFPNLEHLKVYECPIMEALIHIESSGEETITFPKLKFLSLCQLPNLSGLFNNVNIIKLPELLELELGGISNFTSIFPKNELATSCFLEEVVIPKLEKLHISKMENLKEIWPCEFTTSKEVKLREIEVRSCDTLVNLFPCNPLPLLHHLEDLKVMNCVSIEVLFNIYLDCVSEIGEGSSSSNLRHIEANDLGKLREVWRIKGANNSCHIVRGFQAVESIRIESCQRFRSVFTPTTTNFDLDLGARKEKPIDESGNNESVDSSLEEEIWLSI